MKKAIIIICIFVLLTNVVAGASISDELTEIKLLLEKGTIESYETILIPLKGDPENFNITPTDDLSTIQFGNGVEGYTVDFTKLEQAYNNGEKNASPYLVKENKYYFPVIVSGREVAITEIVKNESGFRVLCVTAGSVSENFIKAEKNIDLANAKYINHTSIINGFILNNGEKEVFVDLDEPISDDMIDTVNLKSEEDSVIKDFIERNSTTEDRLLIGGGASGTDNKINVTLYIVFVVVAVIGTSIICITKRAKSK